MMIYLSNEVVVEYLQSVYKVERNRDFVNVKMK